MLTYKCINLLGGNLATIKKNTETLIDASREFVEINVEETKYVTGLSTESRSKS
jgi:hypothetical protein